MRGGSGRFNWALVVLIGSGLSAVESGQDVQILHTLAKASAVTPEGAVMR